MLSIIISSYRPDYYIALQKNIAATCGIVYEIIKVENPGIMGTCAAYNIGAEKAQYENLLFLHEDVEFVTENWGGILINHLTKPNAGVIGIAGSTYVPHVPFCWWDHFENTVKNIQQFSGKNRLKNYQIAKTEEVVVVDGVFLGCTKNVYEQVNFNENISGFHGYDLDFSVRAANISTNFVIHNITLKHFSEGKPDRLWWENLVHNRSLFSAPQKQKIDKKKESFFYKKLEERLLQFNTPNKKQILLKYNNPFLIGYKVAFKNMFKILFK